MLAAHSLAALGLAASLVGVTIAATTLSLQAPAPHDPCAVDVAPDALSARDRTFVTRRLLACSDVTHGRITPGEYRRTITMLDEAWSATPPPPPAPLVTQWASSVRGVSTQYTADQWSANRVLGAPDVFPAHGDNVNAWASLGADDREEWIEVAFAQPTHASAVEVYETFNPGAVSAIELVTASGKRFTAYEAVPGGRGPVANKLRAELGCTSEAIAAVKVTLASPRVTGWNELDASGLVPCAEQ